MKNKMALGLLTAVFLVILLGTGNNGCLAATAADATPESFLVSAFRVGHLTVTEATGLREIQAAFGPGNVRTERRSREGMEEIVVLVYIEGAGGSPSLEAVLSGPEKTVYGGVNVLDRRFVTDKGIRVGSTVADIRKVYRIDEFATGGGAVNAMSEDAKMAFVLSGADPGNVSDSAVVQKIRVWTP